MTVLWQTFSSGCKNFKIKSKNLFINEGVFFRALFYSLIVAVILDNLFFICVLVAVQISL